MYRIYVCQLFSLANIPFWLFCLVFFFIRLCWRTPGLQQADKQLKSFVSWANKRKIEEWFKKVKDKALKEKYIDQLNQALEIFLLQFGAVGDLAGNVRFGRDQEGKITLMRWKEQGLLKYRMIIANLSLCSQVKHVQHSQVILPCLAVFIFLLREFLEHLGEQSGKRSSPLNSDVFCSTQHFFGDRKGDVLILQIIHLHVAKCITYLRDNSSGWVNQWRFTRFDAGVVGGSLCEFWQCINW